MSQQNDAAHPSAVCQRGASHGICAAKPTVHCHKPDMLSDPCARALSKSVAFFFFFPRDIFTLHLQFSLLTVIFMGRSEIKRAGAELMWKNMLL